MKIFVLTHNPHLHLIKGFSYLFNKFWTREQEVTLLCYEHPIFKLPDNFKVISIGENDSPRYWSSDLNNFFSSIDDKFIQWTNIDSWLAAPVDFEIYDNIISLLTDDVGRFGLTTDIKKTGKNNTLTKYKTYSIIERKQDENFRISGTWSIWNREYLLNFLIEGRNPWNFEFSGSEEAKNDGYKILGTKDKYAVRMCNVVRSKIPVEDRDNKRECDFNRHLDFRLINEWRTYMNKDIVDEMVEFEILRRNEKGEVPMKAFEDWPLINDSITEKDKNKLVDFIRTDGVRFTQDKNVAEFERQWNEWLNVKHSIFVNSGASANYVMASVMKEIKGIGEVIVAPIGWVSDVASLVNLGFKPVFVDVSFENMSITYENIKKAITKKTIGIILVHCLGFNAINDDILALIKNNDLFFIEDCCEAHGTTYNGKKVGTFGDLSNFSFYFGHHITTIEGGMICTNNDDLYPLVRLFRSHGLTREIAAEHQSRYMKKYPDLNPLFTFAVPGYNVRNHELNAVLGLSQLERLDYNIKRRQENIEVWINNLDSDLFYTEFNLEGNSNFALPLILKNKDKELFERICKILEDNKVEYRIGTAGGGNQARQPYLEKYKFKARNLNNANHIHDYGLYVGNHPELKEYQIISLCEKVNKQKESM